MAEFPGEARRVRYGQVGHQPLRVVVSGLVQPHDRDVRVRAVRIGGRTGQPAAVPQAQDDRVPGPLPALDPGQRFEGEGAPQPGQHGRAGAGQLGREPGDQTGTGGRQLAGDLGRRTGGTVHGLAPRVRVRVGRRHGGGRTTVMTRGTTARTTRDILIVLIVSVLLSAIDRP